MDPITHLSAGLLAGQAAKGDWLPMRRVIPFCMLAAWLPDIDNFIGFLGPEPYLLYHRGITHSVFGGVLAALLVASLAKLASRGLPFLRTALVAYACILLHVFLDVITSYGTQIFAPLTGYRAAFPCVFIIDPLFTLTILAFALLAHFADPRRRYFALVGLAWVLVYPVTNAGVRDAVRVGYAKRLQSRNEAYTAVHVLPDAFSPLYWKVIVETPDSWRVTSVNMADAKAPAPEERWEKADPALLARLAEQSSFIRTYDWFSRFVAVERSALPDGGEHLVFKDLRFLVATPPVREILNGRRIPFTLEADLDASGKLEKAVFEQRGATVVYEATN